MTLWTIYRHPLDYPGSYVARLFTLDAPTEHVLVSDTLDHLRAMLLDAYPGLVCICRSENDEPQIVETWL
jgi:hypothetical protein